MVLRRLMGVDPCILLATPMGSVGERLLSYIDTSMQRDNNYQIAVRMLENFGFTDKDMSISQIADICFVSKASISRFCRFYGHESFKEMHDALGIDYPIATTTRSVSFATSLANASRSIPRICQRGPAEHRETISEENIRQAYEKWPMQFLIAAASRSSLIISFRSGRSFRTSSFLWERSWSCISRMNIAISVRPISST